MSDTNTVGGMRQQAAYSDSDRPIVIVSDDPDIKELDLEVVETYPDTTDQYDTFPNGGTFKIKIRKKK